MKEDVGFFIALERQVWEALRRGDGKADGRLLADNFLGVYESGFGTKAEHVAQVSNGPTVTEFELVTPRLMRLSPVLALLAYEARWRGCNGNSRATVSTCGSMFLTENTGILISCAGWLSGLRMSGSC